MTNEKITISVNNITSGLKMFARVNKNKNITPQNADIAFQQAVKISTDEPSVKHDYNAILDKLSGYIYPIRIVDELTATHHNKLPHTRFSNTKDESFYIIGGLDVKFTLYLALRQIAEVRCADRMESYSKRKIKLPILCEIVVNIILAHFGLNIDEYTYMQMLFFFKLKGTSKRNFFEDEYAKDEVLNRIIDEAQSIIAFLQKPNQAKEPTTESDKPAEENKMHIPSLKEYGFTDADYVHITEQLAKIYLNSGYDIYMLNRDNTADRIESEDELETFHGLFGIAKDDFDKIHAHAHIQLGDKPISNGNNDDDFKPAEDYQAPADCCAEFSVKDLENQEYLVAAMEKYIEKVNSDFTKIPHFKTEKYYNGRDDYETIAKLEKINSIIYAVCGKSFEDLINSEHHKKTERNVSYYNVKSVLAALVKAYSIQHIKYTIINRFPNINAPEKVKREMLNYIAFLEESGQLRKYSRKVDFREQSKYMKNRALMNNRRVSANNSGGGNAENVISDESAEIEHLIECYRQKVSGFMDDRKERGRISERKEITKT